MVGQQSEQVVAIDAQCASGARDHGACRGRAARERIGDPQGHARQNHRCTASCLESQFSVDHLEDSRRVPVLDQHCAFGHRDLHSHLDQGAQLWWCRAGQQRWLRVLPGRTCEQHLEEALREERVARHHGHERSRTDPEADDRLDRPNGHRRRGALQHVFEPEDGRRVNLAGGTGGLKHPHRALDQELHVIRRGAWMK